MSDHSLSGRASRGVMKRARACSRASGLDINPRAFGYQRLVAEPVVLGVLAAPGLAQDLATDVEERLADALRERHPDADWKVEVVDEPSGSRTVRELKETAREQMREHGWAMAVVLTDLPLLSGRRPVTAHASAQQRVAVVSVPALGPVNLEERVVRAVVNSVDGILGERVAGSGGRRGRRARMAARLHELSSPLGAAHVRDENTIRFTTAVVRGNLRLLGGMVRANNPSLVVVRLSRALAAAGGTAAYALTSASIWMLADGASWVRLALLSIATLGATTTTLIVAHHLWESSERPEDREQVVLFNLATLTTVLIGVLTLYLALVLIALGCSYALISPHPFAQQLGHPAGFADHLQLAFLASAIASLAGALGSLTESDFAVREAMYRYQPDARTEDQETHEAAASAA